MTDRDKLRRERDELAQQVEVMRGALEDAEQWHLCDKWRDSDDEANRDEWQIQMNRIDEALALPGHAADILRQRDARTAAQALRDYVVTIPGGSVIDPQCVADDMRRVADELEKSKCICIIAKRERKKSDTTARSLLPCFRAGLLSSSGSTPIWACLRVTLTGCAMDLLRLNRWTGNSLTCSARDRL